MKGFPITSGHISIRYRLVVITILFGFVSVFLLIIVSNYSVDRMVHEEVRNEANMLTSSLDWAIAPLLSKGNTFDIQRLLENIDSYRRVDHIRVYDYHHTIIASNIPAEVDTSGEISVVREVFAKQLLSNHVYDSNTRVYSCAVPIRGTRYNSTEAGNITHVLYIASDINYLRRSFTALIHGVLLQNILLSVLLFIFISIWVLKPLSIFMDAAKHLRRGDYNQKVEWKSTDEFADFADIFNDMIEVIEEKNRHLTMYSENLEVMVRERTMELEASMEQLKQANKTIVQQEKLASIGQLAAGIAHEINNPVGYVLSNIDTLEEYMETINRVLEGLKEIESFMGKGDVDAAGRIVASIKEIKEREDFDFIIDDIPPLLKASLNGTRRIRNIVSDLKNFARMEEDTLEDININDAMEKALQISWNELKYKCSVEKNLGKLPPVRSSHIQLTQVLINLLVNAAQAIETKGTVRITTRYSGKAVEIIIADTGKGISPEHIDNIFDPFFTTKGIGKGTGMGLSISHGIISRHGGSIAVESTPGEGSVFTVSLPVTCENREEEI